MDLTNLEKQLRFTVPEEFYDIAPGEVAYFIPLKGISLTELDKILVINYYLNELHGKAARVRPSEPRRV